MLKTRSVTTCQTRFTAAVTVSSWVTCRPACHLRHDTEQARAETHLGRLPLTLTRNSVRTFSFTPALPDLFATSQMHF